jgi:Flp pilus assembly protein TadD
MSADDVRPADGQPAGATWRSAAGAGDAGAAYELAVLLAERGDVEEAERWLRQAAEATGMDGHPSRRSTPPTPLRELLLRVGT